MSHIIPTDAQVAAETIELFVCDHETMGDMPDALYEEFQAWCAEGDRWAGYYDIDGLEVQAMIDTWLKGKESAAQDAQDGLGDYLYHLRREG